MREPRYAEAARRAADFILKRMYKPDEVLLLRRFRDGDAAIPGFLDDYAFFVNALIDVFETQFEPYHLDWPFNSHGRMRNCSRIPKAADSSPRRKRMPT